MDGTVVIVGGAIVGSMTAYFLRRLGHAGPIVVLERDPSYRHSSTALSAASIRTQFGCPVNVRMSLFGAEFFRAIGRNFGEAADIGFRERGYLILGTAASRAARCEALRMQVANGAAVALLEPDELTRRFPWLDLNDAAYATLGTANEGWFDAWSLLQLVRAAAVRLGVEYRHKAAVGFDMRGNRVTAVRTPDGAVAADWVVNAAGPAAGRVAGWLGVKLAVAPRKRCVFPFKAPIDGAGMPMLFDTGGVWLRPEGDGFICGIAPPGEDPDADGDFTPDHALFEDVIWPALARRIPALEQLRPGPAWAGHYEVHDLDHNGVIGRPDGWDNVILAAGFSGHGVMHAPATGRGVAELILHGAYRSLDLSALGYARVRDARPMTEPAIY